MICSFNNDLKFWEKNENRLTEIRHVISFKLIKVKLLLIFTSEELKLSKKNDENLENSII